MIQKCKIVILLLNVPKKCIQDAINKKQHYFTYPDLYKRLTCDTNSYRSKSFDENKISTLGAI